MTTRWGGVGRTTPAAREQPEVDGAVADRRKLSSFAMSMHEKTGVAKLPRIALVLLFSPRYGSNPNKMNIEGAAS